MEELVSNLKSMGLEHYSEIPLKGTKHKVLKLFFPPPKYELQKRWYWPFGRGTAVEVDYADREEKKEAHEEITRAACETLGKELRAFSEHLLIDVKKQTVGTESSAKANFVHVVPLSKEGQAILERLKRELEKQGVPERGEVFQQNSAGAEFFEWGS